MDSDTETTIPTREQSMLTLKKLRALVEQGASEAAWTRFEQEAFDILWAPHARSLAAQCQLCDRPDSFDHHWF